MSYCIKIVIEEQLGRPEAFDEWHIAFEDNYTQARKIAQAIAWVLNGLTTISKLKL
jgi:hypothetical protein